MTKSKNKGKRQEKVNIILLSNSEFFISTPSMSSNTWTFIYTNKSSVITYDIYKKQCER